MLRGSVIILLDPFTQEARWVQLLHSVIKTDVAWKIVTFPIPWLFDAEQHVIGRETAVDLQPLDILCVNKSTPDLLPYVGLLLSTTFLIILWMTISWLHDSLIYYLEGPIIMTIFLL